jgi:hypothetical protein
MKEIEPPKWDKNIIPSATPFIMGMLFGLTIGFVVFMLHLLIQH